MKKCETMGRKNSNFAEKIKKIELKKNLRLGQKCWKNIVGKGKNGKKKNIKKW